ncbi:MAG: hypothetical protein IJN17_03155 [Clostridia bacterium]|nr:hypothetical protein [Clostridia bacterium]
MSKLKKCIKWMVLATVAVAVAVWVYNWYSTSSFVQPNKEKTEKFLQQDKEDLFVIFDYLSNSEYLNITIDRDHLEKGIMFADMEEQKIEDKTVIKALENLLDGRKYVSVGKSENTVFFEKWRFGERARGIAVPVNKNLKPVVEFLVNYELLSKEGWYYYEADYGEYRLQSGY